MAELTPMKQQYNEIKARHEDCLLFFRLGDFYEMFDDDAKTASRELDLALTTRDRGKPLEEQTPMCGVPYHSAEAYIGRLIAKGYKVAICEQMEDPAIAKGIVTRDVVRIISPGTVTEASMLEEGRSNYLASVCLNEERGAVAFADISTGEFCVSAFDREADIHIINELARFSPKEAVLDPGAWQSEEVSAFLTKRLGAMIQKGGAKFDAATASGCLCSHFSVENAAELGLGGEPEAVCAAGALLQHIIETQKFDISHINRLELFSENQYMELDYTTIRNLELTESLRTGDKKGSLLWVLDHTKTPMGGRMLRSWVERPLLNPTAIRRRQSAVDELHSSTLLRSELMLRLRELGDMRRLGGKAVYGTANAKDLRALGNYIAALPEICGLISECKSRALQEIAGMDKLSDLHKLIDEAIADEPPFSVREGGMIRPGFNEEVDRLRDIRDNGARLVRELEERERQRTGIKKLKLGYNKVFGYYIDVPRSAGDVELPEEYIRKQTLVSNERYFTPELKELENSLLGAGERLNKLEYELFNELRIAVAFEVLRIQQCSDAVGTLDCLCSLAEAAVRNRYCMPDVDMGRRVFIDCGRHPVVERAQPGVYFVPNDTSLDDGENRVAIITGPNMAGKSTYMRQTALIVLMAQMGSFVPARSASVGIVDRVFTRIGASDDLAAGQSTFMVEMSEVANILRHATERSLLVLDEIGRGTSTYDGMAIARAVLEYCAEPRKLGAKTMFATHYHELSALEGALPGVKNYNISAKKQEGRLVFLRKIVPGAADRSYGIEVAKLAGVPESIINKANAYLRELEGGAPSGIAVPAAERAMGGESADAPGKKSSKSRAKVLHPDVPPPNMEGYTPPRPVTIPKGIEVPKLTQLSLADMGVDEVRERLRRIDPNTMTPLEALTVLYELKKKVEM